MPPTQDERRIRCDLCRNRQAPYTRVCFLALEPVWDSPAHMKRTAFETALVIAVIALALEVVHYRNAVLDANVDRKRAWKTVVELRQQCEEKGIPTQPR